MQNLQQSFTRIAHTRLHFKPNHGQHLFGDRSLRSGAVMSIDGNTLAKYLVMVSQVIAWCTVSVMLLRRGLYQVHAVTQQSPYGSGTVTEMADRDDNVTATVAIGGHDRGTPKSFDDNGMPAVVAGVIMITIAIIMLIISPTIMLIKMLEKRKRRILESELASPPKYEDVVESAPRYSSLFVFNNEGEMVLLSKNIQHKEKDNIEKQLV